VRITRADYVEAITESVYRRMEAERKRVANELRPPAGPRREDPRRRHRQREVTVANAYRDAEDQGRGDAHTASVYAEVPPSARPPVRSSTAAQL
jgi:membrane protease subunit HflC